MVMITPERISEIRCTMAASVVVFPEPVTPVTSTRPRRNWQKFSVLR